MGKGFKGFVQDLAGTFNVSSVKPSDEYSRTPDPNPWSDPAVIKAITAPISDWQWRGMVESGQVKFGSEEATTVAKADAVLPTQTFKPEAPATGIAAPKTASFKKSM
ncbi:MAG TPA: hypothetical protein VEF76_12720 [Patescibacteria group bacterium]|nr:hypothetical protein [Patescibacteria group bacterium]